MSEALEVESQERALEHVRNVRQRLNDLFRQLDSAQQHIYYLRSVSTTEADTCLVSRSTEDVQDGRFIGIPPSLLRQLAADEIKKGAPLVEKMMKKVREIERILDEEAK